jgi:hypothetical protein
LLDGAARARPAISSFFGRVARLWPRLALAAIVGLVVANSIRQSCELRDVGEHLRPARDAAVLGDVSTVSTEALSPLLPRDRQDIPLLRERVLVLRRLGLGPFSAK